MYNLASKLFAPLFDPLTLAVLLVVCALLAWKRRRLALRLLIVSMALLLAFSSMVVASALAGSLERSHLAGTGPVSPAGPGRLRGPGSRAATGSPPG